MISDPMKRAEIVFAETCDLEDDPANVGGLKAIREGLASLIRDSDLGIGFAAPAVPTVADLAQRPLLQAWQDCAAAAANPGDTPTISGNRANVAIFSNGDPLQDVTLTKAYPWLAKAPSPKQIGRAKRGNLDVALFVTIAPDAVSPGRYPRDGERFAVVEQGEPSKLTGFPNQFVGGIVFLIVLAILIAPAIIAGLDARLLENTPKRAEIVEAQKAVYGARSDLEAKLKANDPPSDKGSKDVAAAGESLRNATAALATLSGGYKNLVWKWVIATIGLLALLAMVSWGLQREVLGFLVDERGRMSLARFQFVAWVLTILGGYWVAAAWNVGVGYGDPDSSVPLPQMSPDLWILLGIVVTSPLVSSLILNVKATTPDRNATPNGDTVPVGANPPPQAREDTVGEQGTLDIRTQPRTSSFLDLFTGEEVGNRAAVDISRVQQFVFTLIALFAYLGLLATMFMKVTPHMPILAMPEISPYVVGLLAVSHAAYLAAKSIPKN
jgi:hypothetical protein